MAERIGGSMRRTAGGLSRRFMVAVAAGVLVLAVAVLTLLFLRQQAELESRLGQLSQNELSSLEALTVSVMNKRPEDPENVAIAVFDAWFARRNADYNGAVWTAWGPKVAAYKKESEPAGPSKPPRDAVDEEALATGRPVGRFVGNAWRYSLPIVLGAKPETSQPSCYGCHGAMGVKDGEVIAVLSSSLDAGADRAALTRLLAAVAGAAAVLAIILVLAIRSTLGRLVLAPVAAMTAVMGRLARGDLSVEIPGLDRHDEVGEIARAVGVFKDTAEARQRMEREQAEAVRRREERLRRLDAAVVAFEADVAAVLRGVAESSLQLERTATELTGAATDASGRSRIAAAAAERTSTAVREINGAAERLAESIREIGGRTRASDRLAHDAGESAARSGQRSQALAEAVGRIGECVHLIDAIAGETGLLALNATLEAARAGESGRGFAVVASAVKQLAGQTLDATDQIRAAIAAIRGEADAAAGEVRDLAVAVDRIGESSAGIAQATEAQDTATRDIARTIEETAGNTADLSRVIAEVSRRIAGADDDARAVLVEAHRLREQAKALEGTVGRLLAELRVG